ncbi:MAG: 16S rRNA (cytosine(1402)-N(4))-methyltransferase [Candidatus Blackburnbacteria bacterium RIFCSPHIGHO2_02_FULL_39_13]|uniref:Ribosomal RNA small subunit methyltransferase H n=1 Tax=Candidatus Blackburnbacteria bacterium RIFCSPLOWO2_01_FULL_40_20 TaxID=1797519 RepID=A0A1G1VE72_9BACT|nr:MAG: 16S rRNA (cytosine(1402)-N(4))-methyltransferase [Candidatus Blackburnbacteria bacterium RIFCSPHIGHO2_01_FULL_40_17]OGY09187.1 MAG: 16S rRNA (cytosine(1402)-N(4))-methyltransferase [Candidatus Blackburnbacteria bacterium RIFCSPHIGHO2_02_FULL_39_13]OGY13576.1 MAG: 16S rRNA (cytosine(1402)-N(4))-methyltransferase [Candidatus Blackburnbacteria bacterium RIFCSPLOWO2_01_FULL_40_20]HBL52228.1 16S rRNA (cytosine(1402)-N(4))-methyltransferase [Candidatus Blackburnbacteria bacterium]
MLQEVIDFLNVKPGRRFIDATTGGGGHIEAILKMGGEVLGIDQDPVSLNITRKRLNESGFSVFKLVQGNFANLQKIASGVGFTHVDGVLFDLGFASFQLEDSERGLSFLKEGPLDMRLDPNLGVTAADLINSLSENQLVGLFREVGEERLAQSIARQIVSRRVNQPFLTTQDLKKLVEDVYARKGFTTNHIHPATKVFMSLRIVVNNEFENLKNGLEQAFQTLKIGGRIVVISFHSGEDRIVKDFVKTLEKDKVKILVKKPLAPTQEEIKDNPRSRSAKLRAIEKI